MGTFGKEGKRPNTALSFTTIWSWIEFSTLITCSFKPEKAQTRNPPGFTLQPRFGMHMGGFLVGAAKGCCSCSHYRPVASTQQVYGL